MGFALTTALKDVKRRLADPFALAIWAGIPILIGGLIGAMSGGGGAALRAHVLVADQDQTLSRLVAGSTWGDLLETEAVELEEGRRRMDAGEATALVALVAGVGLGVGTLLFDYPPRALPGALAWCAFTGMALFAMLLLVPLFASSRRAGNLLYMVVVFPLIMLGGSFFPFEAMPQWMRTVGELTPNGIAVVQLKDILLERIDPAAFLRATVALAVPALVAFLLSLRRLRRFAVA